MATSRTTDASSFSPLASPSHDDTPGGVPERSQVRAGDFEQLLSRLLCMAFDHHENRGEVVADLCKEIERVTGGLLAISLFRPEGMHNERAFHPEGPRYLICLNDRAYGLVIVTVDPAHPAERRELSIRAHIIANMCALIFYYLEASAFFHDHSPHYAYPQMTFTKRERDVLTLMGQGDDDHTIAARLHIAPTTVRSHRERIYGKLDVHTLHDAIIAALGTGAYFPFEPLTPRVRITTKS